MHTCHDRVHINKKLPILLKKRKGGKKNTSFLTIILGVMEKKREEMKAEFLALSPLQRILKMNKVFNDLISLKAKTMGVSEYEIYRRYLKPGR